MAVLSIIYLVIHFSQSVFFVAVLAFNCVVAYFLSVCFEIPMATVEKLIFKLIELPTKALTKKGKT